MVEFSKGALMKSFKHVALAITATATLAGAGMAQAQDGPSKPWSNDAMYNQQMDVAAQRYNATAQTVQAKYNSGMAECNTKFTRNLGSLSQQVDRNKRSGNNHSGLEKFGAFTGLSQTGNALTECQTRAKTWAQTTMSRAKTDYMTTEMRLDAQYAKAYGYTIQSQQQSRPQNSAASHEAAKLAACQKQEIASLSGRTTITPACQTILRNAPR